jgi:hypothetical protein
VSARKRLGQREANKQAIRYAAAMVSPGLGDFDQVFGDLYYDDDDQEVLDKAQQYAERRILALIGEKP